MFNKDDKSGKTYERSQGITGNLFLQQLSLIDIQDISLMTKQRIAFKLTSSFNLILLDKNKHSGRFSLLRVQ